MYYFAGFRYGQLYQPSMRPVVFDMRTCFKSYKSKSDDYGTSTSIERGTAAEFSNFLRYIIFPENNGGLGQPHSRNMQEKYKQYLSKFKRHSFADGVVSFRHDEFASWSAGVNSECGHASTFHFINIPVPEFLAYLDLIKDNSGARISVLSGPSELMRVIKTIPIYVDAPSYMLNLLLEHCNKDNMQSDVVKQMHTPS